MELEHRNEFFQTIKLAVIPEKLSLIEKIFIILLHRLFTYIFYSGKFIVLVTQEFRSSLSGKFFLRVYHEVAVTSSARRANITEARGCVSNVTHWQFHAGCW